LTEPLFGGNFEVSIAPTVTE